MPGSREQADTIIEAVKRGKLTIKDINKNIERILYLILETPRFKGYKYSDKPDLEGYARTARKTAGEGMVLLKNENETLPFKKKIKKIAAFGITSYDSITGGTGSGDVNKAYTVSVTEGLKNAGYTIDRELQELYEDYGKTEKAKLSESKDLFMQFLPQQRIPEWIPEFDLIHQKAKETDIALITIGRNSGEFIDRRLEGDFLLTPEEKKMIQAVTEVFRKEGKRTVVILNVGGVIETASWKELPDAILLA